MGFLSLIVVAGALTGDGLPGSEAYLAGHGAEREGRYAEAVEAFEVCAATEGPLASYAAVRAAVSRRRGGDHDGAAQRLREVVDRLPDGPWGIMARAELAMLLKEKGRHEEALPFFDAVLAAEAAPSWLRRYKWAAATSRLAHPESMMAGLDALAGFLATSPSSRERLDAARRLAGSPTLEHRFLAAEALLDNREVKEAPNALMWLKPLSFVGDPDARARYLYLEGRYLVEARDRQSGRDLLTSVVSDFPETLWARRARACLIRDLLGEPDATAGVKALEGFVRDCPDTPETAGVVWWWANRLLDQENYEAAIAALRRLAEVCPSQERAETALARAAELLRRRDEGDEAFEVYKLLAARYPSGPRAAEAWFRCGDYLEKQGDRKGARAAYAEAGRQPLGNFYAHRALDRLVVLGESPQSAGAVTFHLDTGTVGSLVRPRAFESKAPNPGKGPEAWFDKAWYKRLAFFGANGLEEAEWEGLYATSRLRDDPYATHLYEVLAELGLAATASEFARAAGWGEKDGVPTIERLRVEFPRSYWPQVAAAAKETSLDPYLILALARQESLFMARAVSSAGAVGVMQVMPSTAKWLSRAESAIAPEEAEYLEHPTHSLRLGAYYLARMIERADGNLVYALAAYNAGPGNLEKWRKAYPTDDMQSFIDRIPFTETRGFVPKVLGNYAAYYSLYVGEREE